MGMSHHVPGAVPAEGYVSVITLNPPAPADPLLAVTSHMDHNPVLLSHHPLQTFTQVAVPDDQTLLILSSQAQVQNGLLKNNEPQLLLLDVPTAGQAVLQTASLVQIAPNQQLSLIQTPTLSLMQPSVELLQFPNNTIYLTEAEQPLILCLQNAGQQQLTLQTQQPLDAQTIVIDDLIQSSDSAMNQVAMAKSWHNDADLVNRAMLALNRQSPHALTHDLPLSSCSTSHRLSSGKDEDRILAEA